MSALSSVNCRRANRTNRSDSNQRSPEPAKILFYFVQTEFRQLLRSQGMRFSFDVDVFCFFGPKSNPGLYAFNVIMMSVEGDGNDDDPVYIYVRPIPSG